MWWMTHWIKGYERAVVAREQAAQLELLAGVVEHVCAARVAELASTMETLTSCAHRLLDLAERCDDAAQRSGYLTGARTLRHELDAIHQRAQHQLAGEVGRMLT
jgi:neutral trehalase